MKFRRSRRSVAIHLSPKREEGKFFNSHSILSSGGAERSIRGDGDSVDVARVTVVVGSELALGEFPDLESEIRRKSQLNLFDRDNASDCFQVIESRRISKAYIVSDLGG